MREWDREKEILTAEALVKPRAPRVVRSVTRCFFFTSLFATVFLIAGAIVASRSPMAALLSFPAVLLHGAVLLAYARAKRPRVKAYYPVVQRPAIAAIGLLVTAPLGALVASWVYLPVTWAAALFSVGAFHIEYQSIRESERGLSEA